MSKELGKQEDIEKDKSRINCVTPEKKAKIKKEIKEILRPALLAINSTWVDKNAYEDGANKERKEQ